jgi:endonuclease/exonuclease/phosphatase family metal-dependent hydrolase
MLQLIKAGIAALALALSTTSFAADVTIGSWNVKRLGQSNQQSYAALGEVASKFDLLALQEVMNEDGLAKLEAAVEKASGEDWGRIESHAIGSHRYKEMYAFLYRESKVTYDEGAVVYLDRGDRFFREPFSAKFRVHADGSSIVMSSVHILYGKSVEDRIPEIQSLAEYWQWLAEVYPGEERILAGDFNLAPTHPAWRPLLSSARPLILNTATTLSGKDGRFANAYDNLFIAKDSKLAIKSYGVVNFPRMIGWNHEKSRKHVSDHAPVYLTLDKGPSQASGAAIPSPFANSTGEGMSAAYAQAASAVTQAPAGAVNTDSVRGNRNSMLYHFPRCPSYSRIATKNQVEFSNADQAQAAGYKLAGNCR